MNAIASNLPHFPERLGYGGSMGGYGVSVFANIFRFDRVLLMNPISTLNGNLVPWEPRFPAGRSLNWESGLNDGAKMTCPGYIVYDPLHKLDRRHAERYANLVHLKFFGVGHTTPDHLVALKLLKPLFLNFVKNTIDKKQFQHDVRARRTILPYYEGMLNLRNRKLTPKRQRIIIKWQSKFLKSETIGDIAFRIDPKYAEPLRDSAILLEKHDLKKAHALMELAFEAKQGPGIYRKLLLYRKKLKISKHSG